MARSKGPLHGLVVVDLTQFLSGPYATQILADLGAEIVKVEPPRGDSSRAIRSNLIGDESAYFLSINRSKRSVAVDLKRPEGRQVVLDLVARADVVIENYRPGILDRLGLGYDALRERNPRVVLASISGFGQDGPYRDRPAYDVVIQAMSGGMSLTGPIDGEPVRAGIAIGDLSAGMCAVIGALAAVREAVETGEGRHVDVSMLDTQLSMLTYQATYYLASSVVPGPQGRDHVSIPTYRSFRCADGRDLLVAANTERMWQDLCRAIGRPDLPDDPDFADNEQRLRNRKRLDDVLEEAFRERSAVEWDRELAGLGVPAAPLYDLEGALRNEQVRHRRMVLDLADADGNPVPVIASPIRFLDGPLREPARPPRLGEHTAEVLRDLGRTDREIGELAERGVVVVAGEGST